MPEAQQTFSHALPHGYHLGGYVLDKVLGQGGFGITYLAHHAESAAQVVIKENLPAKYAFRDPSSRQVFPLDTSAQGRGDYEWALKNFYNEAQLLSTLDHPGIVNVLRAFHALGTAYYVMPYVGGMSLGQWAEEHPRPEPEKVLPLLDSLLSSLHYLHSHNILHRDIKPANIIMTGEGVPILIDFGTARQIISDHSATLVSSPGYTPYEQLQIHGKKNGPWTDVYALGATMYHVLTGGRPVDCGDRMGEDGDPLIPLCAQPGLVERYGEALLASIDKAMQVSRRRRWQSAEAWRKELAEIGGGSSRAKLAKTAATVLITLAACICIGGYLYFGERRGEPSAPVVEKPAPVQPNQAALDSSLLEAAISGTVQEAQAALDAGADIGTRDTQGRTALHLAAGRGDMEMACLLLERGALFNAKDSTGHTPADAAKADSHDELYVSLLKKAAENADAGTQFNLALMFYTGDGVKKDETEAVAWFRKAADQGLAEAQNTLGIFYAFGKGVPKDPVEAAKWYRKAADQGNADAQFTLGMCYLNGDGVDPNPTEAAKWFRKAAEQGDAEAQFNLGVCYENGTGVDADETKAAEWYRRAAEQGDADAQLNLGVCYLNGDGVDPNPTEAVKWFRKAAAQGVAEAQFILGACYLNGDGVNQNSTEAVKWFRKAADQGNADAQNTLGIFYAFGKGVPKDPVEAAKWYRKAADQGNADAQFTLGMCYLNGNGVDPNPTEAAEWFRKAAEQGNAGAMEALKKLGY